MLTARRFLVVAAVTLVALLSPEPTQAGPIPRDGVQGMALARKGKCQAAIPLLELSELESHSPAVAFALAQCYAGKERRLFEASEIFHRIHDERFARPWTGLDRVAVARAGAEAIRVDRRIPTVGFEPTEAYDGIQVTIDGRLLPDLRDPERVMPDKEIAIVATAPGFEEQRLLLTLRERERRVVPITLAKRSAAPGPVASPAPPTDKGHGGTKAPAGPAKGAAARPARSERWLGARARASIVPEFLFDAFVDGGRTLVLPGGDVTFTTSLGGPDLVAAVGYANYAMSATLIKPNGTPNSYYEIVESTMHAVQASVGLYWDVPLSARGDWALTLGVEAGVGAVVLGDLIRTQAYPTSGKDDDLDSYAKCKGPSEPPGTYRYCNQLDWDKDHYGYREPSWYQGGARPTIYPVVALPVVELGWYPTPSTRLSLGVGLSMTGFASTFGVRLGL